MQLYVVFEKGVYRHDCGGVFSTLKKASQVAAMMANKETDNYHSYEVVPFVLDDISAESDVLFSIGGEGL